MKGGVCLLKIIQKNLDSLENNSFFWLDQHATIGFDIETTGFSRYTNFIYLIGYLYKYRGQLIIKQLLAEKKEDEIFILEEFLNDCKNFDYLLTFNGNQFDIPFVITRADIHGLNTDLFEQMKKTDLFRLLKPLKKILPIPNSKQKSFEDFLQTNREDQMDGGQLIQIYLDYEKKASSHNEELLLLHNYEDVLGLLRLQILHSYFKGISEKHVKATSIQFYESSREVVIKQELSIELPKPISFQNQYGYFHLEKNCRKVLLKLTRDDFRLPLLPYKDYVYLISEDCVIPKLLSTTVAPSNCQKATSKNCFIKTNTECILLPLFLKEELDALAIPILYPHGTGSLSKPKDLSITLDSFLSHSSTLSKNIANQLFQHCIC